MTRDVFDNDLHNYLDDLPFECPVCGGDTPKEGYPCSGVCFEADMM